MTHACDVCYTKEMNSNHLYDIKYVLQQDIKQTYIEVRLMVNTNLEREQISHRV